MPMMPTHLKVVGLFHTTHTLHQLMRVTRGQVLYVVEGVCALCRNTDFQKIGWFEGKRPRTRTLQYQTIRKRDALRKSYSGTGILRDIVQKYHRFQQCSYLILSTSNILFLSNGFHLYLEQKTSYFFDIPGFFYS